MWWKTEKGPEIFLVWKTFKQQFLAENSILCVPLGNKLVDRHLGFCLSIGWYHSYNLNSIGFYIIISCVDHYFRISTASVLAKTLFDVKKLFASSFQITFSNWKLIFTPPTCSLEVRVTTSQLNNQLKTHHSPMTRSVYSLMLDVTGGPFNGACFNWIGRLEDGGMSKTSRTHID